MLMYFKELHELDEMFRLKQIFHNPETFYVSFWIHHIFPNISQICLS